MLVKYSCAKKAFFHPFGSGAFKNGVKIAFKEVSKSQLPFSVKTTRHHGAVAQNGDLVNQSVASALFSDLLSILGGPEKTAVKFQIQMVCQGIALAVPFPLPGEILL